MRTKLCLLSVLVLCLCSCGQERLELPSELPALSISEDVITVFDNASVPKERIDLPNGDYIHVVIPDGYTKLNISDDLQDVKLAYISDSSALNTENPYVLVEWLLVPTDSLGVYVVNPLKGMFDESVLVRALMPNPVVSDVCMYITGDVTCVGSSIRNYLDLSAINIMYPTYVIPEVNYVFNVDSDNSLLLRVAYNAEELPMLVQEATNAVNDASFKPSADLSTDVFKGYDTAIEGIALEICKYALYYKQ